MNDIIVPGARQAVVVISAPAAWLNANQRNDRRAETPVRRAWRNGASVRARSLHVAPFQKAHLLAVMRFTENRRRDLHNLYPTLKACVDGFVDAGLLPDDSSEYLIGPDIRMGQPYPKKLYGPVGEVIFTITDISGSETC